MACVFLSKQLVCCQFENEIKSSLPGNTDTECHTLEGSAMQQSCLKRVDAANEGNNLLV
jgi:hypothetical protein